MSAREITDRVIKEINSDKYDFIAMNFANADMVAHTGDIKATVAGIETIDECLGRIVDAILPKGGAVLITADHGNSEELANLQTGEIDKEHSTNPVPFIAVSKKWEGQTNPTLQAVGGDLSLLPPVGMLADVAPTILAALSLEPPAEMTGRSLL
jgi:2,3-bisphosphoglycerate-independent phosphoglycerate mutase